MNKKNDLKAENAAKDTLILKLNNEISELKEEILIINGKKIGTKRKIKQADKYRELYTKVTKLVQDMRSEQAELNNNALEKTIDKKMYANNEDYNAVIEKIQVHKECSNAIINDFGARFENMLRGFENE